MAMAVIKGQQLFRTQARSIILLQNGDISNSLEEIPKVDLCAFTSVQRPFSEDGKSKEDADNDFMRFMIGLKSQRTYESHCTIISLHLVSSGFDLSIFAPQVENESDRKDDPHLTTFEPPECLQEGWTFIQDKIEWKECCEIYMHVTEYVLITTLVNPLQSYATSQLLELSDEEFAVASKICLGNGWIDEKRCQNRLAVSHQLQTFASEQPDILVAVLPCGRWPVWPLKPTHMPTAVAELRCENKIKGGKGDNCNDANEISPILFVEVDAILDMESRREASVAILVGASDHHDCACLRCQYDKIIDEDDALDTLGVSGSQLKRLAGSYLADQQLDISERLMWKLVDGKYASLLNESQRADVWHMIGAVHLTKNRFLKAQKHWKEGVEKHGHDKFCTELQSQYTKQKDYRYFEEYERGAKSQEVKLEIPEYQSLGSSVFLAPNLVDVDTCRKLILWADQSQWTTSRHYAVPTTDVPVQKVTELLSWFNQWMENSVQPLLARQFGDNRRRFYVHDAFVVRYAASKSNKYLPLHHDESTHSFVLSLNDYDDDENERNDNDDKISSDTGYTGGGTYFYEMDEVVRGRTGDLVTFLGNKTLHGGNVVTSGVRYILTGFLYADEDLGAEVPKGVEDQGENVVVPSKRQKIVGSEDGLSGAAPFQFGFF